MVDVILGLQWGDEGKGKIVDYFATIDDIIEPQNKTCGCNNLSIVEIKMYLYMINVYMPIVMWDFFLSLLTSHNVAYHPHTSPY